MFALWLAAALLLTFAPHPDARAAEANTVATTISVADYRTGGRTDAQAIRAAIAAASPGDTVYFPGGTYRLDEPFLFGSGVNHVGDPNAPAVLLGTGATSLSLKHTAAQPVHNVTIRGLHFDNVEVDFGGTGSYTEFSNITLKDCLFRNGKQAEPWTSYYVRLSYTVGATVDGCTFLRNSASGGTGVRLNRSRLSVIKDSFFGTTRDLEAGIPNGYFKTAINVHGYEQTNPQLRNREIVIDGNVWRRTANVSCPSGGCEDHGLYAWGFDGLVVRGNYTDGWTNTSSGGGMKIRNGDNTFGLDNHLMTSGIRSYTHTYGAYPRHFYRARFEGNRFDLLGSDEGHGLFYRRAHDDGSSTGPRCDGDGVDDDIYLIGNKMVDGSRVDVRCAEGPEICVQNNQGAELSLLEPGVRTTGCSVPDSWDRPLAGIHRGDFNGDGAEDFVQWVPVQSGTSYWRAHLSAGDGFLDQNWGDGVRVASDTEKYGVHVADFNGDGRDDIAYMALCGTPARDCWRVHHSTGTGFMTPKEYGDGVYHSAETFRFGFHTGDYNGDGRADIAFRGACGGDGHDCWRVLVSQPDDTFAAMDWGDEAYWDPGHTDDYGLLVGDYNGDGRDDIAYRGRCGSADPCLRVHVSMADRTFQMQNWGAGFYLDGPVTPHFGMRVGDVNGDGYADISYRGRCGSSRPTWRHHLGGAAYPFTISCSTSN